MPTRVKKNPDLLRLLASSLLVFPGQQPLNRFPKLPADLRENFGCDLRRETAVLGDPHTFHQT
jgi:hypothetical protein